MRAPAEARSLAAAAVAGLLLATCGGSSTTSPTSTSEPPTTSATSASPEPASFGPTGYTAAIIRVTRADGTTESYCVWLATTEVERERGLMGVTSLGGATGMLFRFGTDQSASFWMKDTLLPLSVAFFTSDGSFVSAADMDPCPPQTPACPTYPAAAPYADALEVAQGALAELGVAAGAKLEVTTTSCEPGG